MSLQITDEEFESLIADAIDSLPKEYIEKLDNVAIVAGENPDVNQRRKAKLPPGGLLFGLYEGVPKVARSSSYTMMLPDKITIFKGPLTFIARDKEHLRAQIKNTVWHEIAHHFGLNHDRIHELEDKARDKIGGIGKDLDYEQSSKLKELGVNNAVFTRAGGVSEGPFASLNVKHRIGDRPENVEENRRRAMSELNLADSRMVFANDLAHDIKIIKAGVEHAGRDIEGFDGLITDVADLPLAMSVADCIPIFYYDSTNKAIGLAHAGWRGLHRSIPELLVKAMAKEYGSKPRDIIVVIGPSIFQKSYQVGKDVADFFDTKYIDKKGDDLYLDLRLNAADQLAAAGIKHIESLDFDTRADKRFYSYRRDRFTGRNLAVISL